MIYQIKKLEKVFKKIKIDVVINLAAQAGVRYSIDNPDDYTKSNLIGFSNILEMCRRYKLNTCWQPAQVVFRK